MQFRPFGDPFEIRSALSPATLKRAIRDRSKGWFDMNLGARGWIVGPIVCLWHCAFEKFGPVLIGRIQPDGYGSKVSGVAGSGLYSLLFFVPILSVLIVLVSIFGLLSSNRISPLVFFLILILTAFLWGTHASRKAAEPLVRFLKQVAGASAPKPRVSPANVANVDFADAWTLQVNGGKAAHPVTSSSLNEALSKLGEGGVAVLATTPETYIQTVWLDDGFVVEKREGSSESHFRATHVEIPSITIDGSPQTLFAYDLMLAIVTAYASEEAPPPGVEWERMSLRTWPF